MPDGALGEWQDEWETGEQLPLMVEVTITGADGEVWPPVVVALPLASSTIGFAPQVVHNWRQAVRGKFPPETFDVLSSELASLGLEASKDLWRMYPRAENKVAA